MSNTKELIGLARTLAYDMQADKIGPTLADAVSECLNRCSDELERADRERQAGEPVAWRYETPTGWHATTDAGKAMSVRSHHPIEPLFASPPAPQEAQADSTPLLPVARIRSWTKHGEGHGDLVDWLEGSENLPDGEYDLYLGPQSEQKPVASIYISPNGEREFDDWKHDLPIGRNELFAAPVAQPASVTTTAHAIHEALNPGAPVEWPLEDEEQPATAQAEAPSDLSVLRRIHKLLVNQVRPALRSPVITKDVDDAAEALSALMSRTQTEAPSDSTLKLAEMILADCGHSTAISTRLRDRVAERIERHLAAQPTEASCRSTNADGHVLLPFEPTDEMEVAAEDAYEESGSPFPNWKAVYRAMRDAAPSPDGKAEQALASSDPEGHRQAITDHEAEQAEASSENQRNDSVVDRYLRNNLDDDDYAAFSAALGCLYAPQAEAPSDAAREVLAAGIVHHYGVPEEASFACARRVLALASKPPAIDWSQAGRLMEAAMTAKAAGFTTGTTNWAAHICRAMGGKPPAGEQKPVGEGFFTPDGECINASATIGYLGLAQGDAARGCTIRPLYTASLPEQVAQDSARLDWLCEQFVTVRTPMRYGSAPCFLGSPDDNDGESVPWDIRAAIDAARARGEGGPKG